MGLLVIIALIVNRYCFFLVGYFVYSSYIINVHILLMHCEPGFFFMSGSRVLLRITPRIARPTLLHPLAVARL